MKNLHKTLGLNNLEQKVVESVTGEFKMVADIARDINVPRTSVDAVVARLVDRKIIKKQKKAKRFLYKKISDIETIKNMFPEKALPPGKYSLPLYEGFHLNLYSGTKDIMTMFENLCIKHSKERVYGIQSTSSVGELFKFATLDEINYINSLVTTNDVVQDSIIDDEYFIELEKIVGDRYGEWLKGLSDRLAVVHVLPKEDIGFNGLLILHGKVAILVDWKTQMGIEIINTEIMKMLLSMFRSFRRLGSRIELKDVYNDYLKRENS